jgi:hypothetical protein
MDQEQTSTLLKDLGYRLLPPHHRGSPGHSGLLVALRDAPSGRHFDPEALSLPLRDAEGLAQEVLLTRGQIGLPSEHVCPGPIAVSDWRNRRLHFFTFGGRLEMSAGPEGLVLALHSPAPILEVSRGQGSIAEDLASEIRSHLAQATAAWHGDEEGPARHLAQAEPLQFYVASIHTLLSEHRRSEDLADLYRDLDGVLAAEREWLLEQDLWPAAPPFLIDLLGPAGRGAR